MVKATQPVLVVRERENSDRDLLERCGGRPQGQVGEEENKEVIERSTEEATLLQTVIGGARDAWCQ